MKNVIFVLFVFLISSVSLFAQDIEIGKVFDSEKVLLSENQLLEGQNGELFMVGRAYVFLSKKIYIKKFDRELNLIKENEVKMESQGTPFRMISVFTFKEEIYILGYPQKGLSTFKLNQESLEFEEEQIISEKEIAEGDLRTDMSYKLAISPNKTKVAIISVNEGERKNNQEFVLRVFEKGMKKSWEKKVIVPHRANLLAVHDTKLDNNGDFYFLTKIYTKPQLTDYLPFGTEQDYSSKLFIFRNKGNEQEKYPISISGAYVGSSKLTLKSEGNVACIGYYLKKYKKVKKTVGIFYKEIGKEKKGLIKNIQSNFSKEVIASLDKVSKAGTVGKKGTGKDNSLFEVAQLLISKDGSIVVVGENQYTVTKTTTTADGKTNSNTYYDFKDIVATHITKEGSFKWSVHIPKNQRGNVYFLDLSVLAFMKGNELNLIYNADKKYLEKENAQYYTNSKNNIIIQTIVDENGKFKSEEILEDKKALKDFVVYPFMTDANKTQVISIFKKAWKKDTCLFRIKLD
ncbi:hypothetical protein [Bernardetia sp. MNP-M8]|uniref:hypothetical protein n=1 Tax=Bernardetia sp. MNP-M8 TaxID=3127470 RepID=UPI0030D2EE2D